MTFEALIADDAAGSPAALQAALLDVTSDPRLSSQLANLARQWGLLSVSERQRLFAAIEHVLASIQADSSNDVEDRQA